MGETLTGQQISSLRGQNFQARLRTISRQQDFQILKPDIIKKIH